MYDNVVGENGLEKAWVDKNRGAETIIIAISRVLSITLHVFNLFTYQNVLYRV